MYLICTQENGVRFLAEAQKMNSITPRVSDLIKGSIQYTRLRFIFNCIIRLVGMAPHFQCGIRPVRDRHDAQGCVGTQEYVMNIYPQSAALVKRLTRITFYDKARVRIPYAVQKQ